MQRRKSGRPLETLVEHLERVFSDQNHVTIESPKKLRDVATGTLREHDVVLTIRHEHHEVIVAIECRDHNRKITVNQVESFCKKCQDTGVNKGIMVSPKGFSRPAITKAEKHGVRCLALESIDSFEWLLAPGIKQITRTVLHVESTVIPEVAIKEQQIGFKLITGDGKEVPPETILNNAVCRLDQLPPEVDSGRKKVRIPFRPGDIRLRLDGSKDLIGIRCILCDVEYDVSIVLSEFKLMKYADVTSMSPIIDTAVAEIDTGPIQGRVVFAIKPGLGGKVSFLPHERQSTSGAITTK